MDPSLKPDPNRKGSYYRRIQDIRLALEKLDVDNLPPTVQFLAYYFACEKLAFGIVGIHSCCPAMDAYKPGRGLSSQHLKRAAKELGLSVSENDLDCLFMNFKEQEVLRLTDNPCTDSARVLRDRLVHHLGPSNVVNISKHADFLIPKLKSFLACDNQVLDYQKNHFNNIP